MSSSSITTTTMPSSSAAAAGKLNGKRPSSNHHPHHHHHHHLPPPFTLSSITLCPSCRSSPSAATLDLLILIVVLSSCAFLVASSLAHLARSLSLLLPLPLPLPFPSSPLLLLSPFSSSSFLRHIPFPYLAGLFLFLAAALAAAELSCCLRGRSALSFWPARRGRRCGNPRCRGLRKALEFDVQLQTEECIRSPDPAQAAAWKEIDGLPWKGGQQGNNPDYECLRAELRRMAPPNGRAVLLFRARCGCPLTKLEAWGPKRGRRQKKGTNLALEGGDW